MTYTVFNFQRALVKEFDSPNHNLNFSARDRKHHRRSNRLGVG